MLSLKLIPEGHSFLSRFTRDENHRRTTFWIARTMREVSNQFLNVQWSFVVNSSKNGSPHRAGNHRLFVIVEKLRWHSSTDHCTLTSPSLSPHSPSQINPPISPARK